MCLLDFGVNKCGYDTGTFTSPYITKFTNRFQYNGADIEEETLLKLANELKPHVEAIAETELALLRCLRLRQRLRFYIIARLPFRTTSCWKQDWADGWMSPISCSRHINHYECWP